jgi:two-component system, OmpR family, response regulator
VKKILIIDDEKDLCLLLKSYLSKRKHEVYVSYRLNEGIAKALEINPDVIFLDNNLPDGQGWEMADWLQNKFPLLQIVLMSAFKNLPGHVDDEDRVHVLEKPVSFSTLDTQCSWFS